MELEEFHILQRDAAPIDDGCAITGVSIGVGGDLPDASVSASSNNDGFSVEGMQFACGQFHSDHASGLSIHEEQVEHLELIVEFDLVLQALLVERLQDHVTGAVCGMTGAPDRFAGVIVGVPAKGSL